VLPVHTYNELAKLAGVGIETLRDCGAGQLQDLLTHGELQRFQIQIFHHLTAEECFNLAHDVGGQ
jgi:hypothetical protein